MKKDIQAKRVQEGAMLPSTLAPNDMRRAHELASYHREQLERSQIIGCFYCTKTTTVDKILEWIDGEKTALCPTCGIDSMIGDADWPYLTEEFLKAMHNHWFIQVPATGDML